MLRIKFKVQAAGFTLIEMIVIISIAGIVSLIASGFLITMIGGSSKAEVVKEVRQNGNHALSLIGGLVLNSKSVVCPDMVNNRILTIKDIYGFSADISCLDNPDYYISSSSGGLIVRLTGDNVAVSQCSFLCEHTGGRPSKVKIEFVVSQKAGSSKPSEKSSLKFQTEVATKNF